MTIPPPAPPPQTSFLCVVPKVTLAIIAKLDYCGGPDAVAIVVT